MKATDTYQAGDAPASDHIGNTTDTLDPARYVAVAALAVALDHTRMEYDFGWSEYHDALDAIADVLTLMARERVARTFAEMAAQKHNDLLATCANNTAVTCAFCGVVYPAGTPRHGDGALVEHIRVCPQHPLRAAEQRIAELEGQLERAVTDAANYEMDLFSIAKVLDGEGLPRYQLRNRHNDVAARIAELEAELIRLRHNASHFRCVVHAGDASNAWGCPGCVAELREERKTYRPLCERAMPIVRLTAYGHFLGCECPICMVVRDFEKLDGTR